MINKRLVGLVPEAKKHVACSVALQWCGLVCNMVFMGGIALAMGALINQSASAALLCAAAGVSILCIALRLVCTYFAARQSYLASRGVKKILREKIYTKLLHLGSGYTKTISTAELVQLAGEGMPRKAKIRIMLLVTALMAFGFAMMGAVPVGRIILFFVWLFHMIYFVFVVKTL